MLFRHAGTCCEEGLNPEQTSGRRWRVPVQTINSLDRRLSSVIVIRFFLYVGGLTKVEVCH